jgi:hypothetical protein
MSKMGFHDTFEFLKHKLWPKEGPRIKLSIWHPTIKSRESPWSPCMQVVCRWCAKYRWKVLDEGYNFSLNFISKLWASKVAGVSISGISISRISGLQLGSPGTKWHLGAGLVAKHKEYYKGEGGGFPQVRAMVNFMSLCLFVACPCTKSGPTMH